MIFNMVGGGKMPYAFILTTFPSGSSCTCINASGAKDITSNQKLFYVDSSGTYTVSITDGTHAKTTTVSITDEGQSVSITLFYGVYLIKDGIEQTTFVNGRMALNSNNPSIGTLQKSLSDNLLRLSSNGANYAAQYLTQIDVTNYSKLRFSGVVKNEYSQTSETSPRVAIVVVIRIGDGTANNKVMDLLASSTTIKEYLTGTYTDDYAIDISGLAGNLYVGFSLMGTANNDYFEVKDLYLEN